MERLYHDVYLVKRSRFYRHVFFVAVIGRRPLVKQTQCVSCMLIFL